MSGDHKNQTKIKVTERRAKIAHYYLQKKSQTEIAELVGVTQQMVSLDLKAIQKQWLTSTIRDYDTARQKELASIDHLERTYWTAWESSLRTKNTRSVEEKGSGESRRTKQAVKQEDTSGDPRFLEGVRWCIAKRCELLGLVQTGITINDNNIVVQWPTPIGRDDHPPPTDIVIDQVLALPAPAQEI